MYHHAESTIDPRDKHLITWSPKSKRFITGASDLLAHGIQPKSHIHFGKQTYWIWIHSDKFGISIPYKRTSTEKDTAGEPVADIFTPYFDVISSIEETLANKAAQGTQLVILLD